MWLIFSSVRRRDDLLYRPLWVVYQCVPVITHFLVALITSYEYMCRTAIVSILLKRNSSNYHQYNITTIPSTSAKCRFSAAAFEQIMITAKYSSVFYSVVIPPNLSLRLASLIQTMDPLLF